jgi:taurine dioxygenase
MQQQQARPPSSAAAVEVVPTSGGVGAEIRGLDLRRLDKQNVGLVHRAWIDHQVLLFRGQRLNDAELIAFSRLFGNLDVAPNQETGQRHSYLPVAIPRSA